VTAEVDGRVIPVPFNLTSLEILFPSPEAARLQNLLTSKFKFGEKVAILKMLGDGDPDLQELARFIYDKIFLGYTTKQWGLRPEELSPSVTARVPIHVSYDNRYFQDVFQKMPSAGYTKMFERIFNHPNITVELNSEFSPAHPHVSYDRLLYTGAIDEFFG
jgi:UDP-galactopyranose mutase